MKATLIAKAKEVHDDGSIVEVVMWELPEPDKLLDDFEKDIETWSES